MRNIVIIGNGISGITAARHIRKRSDMPITIISAETDHFFSRTALMYIYMGHMKYEHTKPYEDWFWEKNRFDLVRDYIEKVDTDRQTLYLLSGNTIRYDILIIASGSKSNTYGWPGENLRGVQGLYSFQDLENMEKLTEGIDRAVVTGGGLIGIEMTEMLLSRNIEVTFLVREKNFWDVVLPHEEAIMAGKHIREHGVDLRLGTELKAILGDENNRVRAVVTSHGDEIPCRFAGITVGVHPNVDFLKNSHIETDRGVLVNPYFETNIKGIYAIGDCVQFRIPLPGRKAIEQVWYTGRIHGETVAETILGNKTAYKPGPWFNSAKFFDIEYQVYGEVKNKPDANEKSIYWEDKSGKKSIRLVFDIKKRHLLGINLMGVRFLHKACDYWIRNKITIETVLENLEAAVFEPEFSRDVVKNVLNTYNLENPNERIDFKRKRGLAALFN